MPDHLAQRPHNSRSSLSSWLGRPLALCLLSTLLHASATAQQTSLVAFPEARTGAIAPFTSAGSIDGIIVDDLGHPLDTARVALQASSATTETTGPDGRFHMAGLAPGPVTLTVSAPGLESSNWSGILHPDEALVAPEIHLHLPPANTEIEVRASATEIAAAQVSLEEKQRVLGLFPNFYAVYLPDAAPLTSRQKFGMAWKQMADPVTFATVGFVAGVQQAQNDFRGYGQGTQGFAKRLGAGLGDGIISTMLGQAILPSVFHQDPRYFVKGTGTLRARALYAIASTVICKGDRGQWQPNYSNVLGNVASAGISNLYYPASSRHGASLTIENSLLGTAGGVFGTFMQEFVLRRMTPNIPNYTHESQERADARSASGPSLPAPDPIN